MVWPYTHWDRETERQIISTSNFHNAGDKDEEDRAGQEQLQPRILRIVSFQVREAATKVPLLVVLKRINPNKLIIFTMVLQS